MKRFAVVLVALVLLGCKKGETSTHPKDCQLETLPPGTTMIFHATGGTKGMARTVTLFDDGRLLTAEGTKTGPARQLPAARVEKLKTDIAATGVFALKDECFMPPQPEPDGYYNSIVIRGSDNKVHAYATADGAKTPPAVDRALEIAARIGPGE